MYQNLKAFSVPSDFRGKPKIIVQLWWITEKTLFAWSPQFLYGWRRFLLRIFGAKIGKGVLLRPTVRCTYPWKISVGDYSWIGEDCVLYSLGNITIGKHVAIAHGVYLNTGLHNYQKVNFDIGSKDILIEDQAWITNDVYIAPGVKIGKGSVIGARSSVFKNIPEGFICYGNPAIAIKERKIEKQ
jgi:putative colanic acid biosynthesis acetyltransferase WcaF